jgi:hypothetical protein
MLRSAINAGPEVMRWIGGGSVCDDAVSWNTMPADF